MAAELLRIAEPPRVGLYGGAFDPPHRAHVALAVAAIAQARLARLHILPTGQPMHRAAAQASAEHRTRMLQLAFDSVLAAQIDQREIQRTGPSYTIDTVQEIQAENPRAELFVLIGLDQFERLATWHKWRELSEIATFLVATRSTNTKTHGQNDVKIADLDGVRAVFLDLPLLSTSATAVRMRLAQHQRTAEFLDHHPDLHPDVLRYIAHNQLYRNATA